MTGLLEFLTNLRREERWAAEEIGIVLGISKGMVLAYEHKRNELGARSLGRLLKRFHPRGHDEYVEDRLAEAVAMFLANPNDVQAVVGLREAKAMYDQPGERKLRGMRRMVIEYLVELGDKPPLGASGPRPHVDRTQHIDRTQNHEGTPKKRGRPPKPKPNLSGEDI